MAPGNPATGFEEISFSKDKSVKYLNRDTNQMKTLDEWASEGVDPRKSVTKRSKI